jgi:hypothetical protein
MSRAKYYPFWKAPARLWFMRIVFGSQGLLLLFIAMHTLWDAATKQSFTMFKLRPSGSPNHVTLSYATSSHGIYWVMLTFYLAVCLGVGIVFTVIAYAATFRAVIPKSQQKKHEAVA